ncbi:CLUMA_CG019583, isoform A [Clunio marinus]|uniref:CLUMA_CG019583, isoform A n=1 Tax=Clunio marinus TaxID=568069 RepID=A0A1J1J7N6_9DIPT|nr:CLUMA_CG019583, isoform A [Clunio marinus]
MSAFLLDEAIKNVDDETAVNQLVGSLEKSLEQESGSLQLCNGVRDVNKLSDDLAISSNDSQNNVSSLSTNSANFTKATESNNNVHSTINNNHFNHQQPSVSHQQIFSNFVSGQQHPLQTTQNHLNMPKNEPVKLVYPSSNNNNNNAQSSTIVTMNNNRVTFSSAPVQNGTITLSPMTANQISQQSGQQQQTIMQGANIKLAGQTSGGQQAPTLIFKNTNSSSPGTFVTSTPVTMSKTNNQATGSNIVALPSNLLVNIRPQTGVQTVQKPGVGPQRVVINQQIRPQNNTITLQNLPQSMQGNTILLKQDNGSYQLLRIAAAQPGAQVTPGLTPTGGSTIRLQTVPASIASNNTVYVTTSSAPNNQQQQQPQILTTQTTPIVSVSQVPALTTTHQVQSQSQPTAVVGQQTGGATVTQSPTQRNDNAKEKCRKFLTNLIDLSKREPAQVELNVKTLIQELVDANVGPEDFCKKLENLLNAAPQPCLVGFLKRSLPLLRQSLVTKETIIEGINPPSPTVAFSGITAQIPAQIRPIGQTVMSTGNIGQTQIRMVQPGTPRIGQTTIRPTTPQIVRTATPNIRPLTTIRGQTTIVQTNNQIPALHPVSGATIISSGGQIRTQSAPQSRPQTAVHIRPQQQSTQVRVQKNHSNAIQATKAQATGGAQMKQIISSNSVNINNNSNSNNNNNNTKVNNNKSQVSIAVVSTQNSTPTHVVNSKLSTSPNSKAHFTKTVSVSTSNHSHPSTPTTPTKSPTFNNKTTHEKKSQGSGAKTKDKKTLASVVAATAASGSGSAFYPSTFGDDDINDVAAMGGVNLAEESQRILGSTEFVGTQIRSCKDEVLLNLPLLQQRIRQQMARHGLDEPSSDVAVLISHAAQERLKNIIEKLAVIAEHRIDILKIDPRYEITSDVRGQIKFLEELDKAEQKRHEEVEREILLRAAKSRSKTEDPEQAKLKAKAKEMQRAEMEELRHREANNTALQAIGPRKKPKMDPDASTVTTPSSGVIGGTPTGIKTPAQPRPRIKRVNMRDMIFYMEQEKDSCRSTMLYKAYLK